CYSVCSSCLYLCFFLFFSTAPSTSDFYSLSLHDALPISLGLSRSNRSIRSRIRSSSRRSASSLRSSTNSRRKPASSPGCSICSRDRKSTRLNSSHVKISYAVFCLKKKKKQKKEIKK